MKKYASHQPPATPYLLGYARESRRFPDRSGPIHIHISCPSPQLDPFTQILVSELITIYTLPFLPSLLLGPFPRLVDLLHLYYLLLLPPETLSSATHSPLFLYWSSTYYN